MITIIVLTSKDNLSKDEWINLEIQMCKSCTLSSALKNCKSCKFNHALKVIEAEKIELQKDIEALNSLGDAEMESLFESCYL